MKRWIRKRSKIQIDEMAKDLQIQRATATVLANRQLYTKEAARAFLTPDKKTFHHLQQLKDGQKVIELLAIAIKKQIPIMVYGDYDVDGISSTTILTKAILRCGGTVQFYIPHRQKEGYGLNQTAVEQFASDGIGVLLTCDNGISAMPEIARAKELGLTVIVIDHHEPQFDTNADGTLFDILPCADAIVDQKQRACTYPFKHLCAAGISYKIALSLLHCHTIYDTALENELLCFATLATVCDIVDLISENRTIVQLGLRELPYTTNIGLRALIDAVGLTNKIITEYHIGFQIGPCINATGRLKKGSIAVELFCTEDIKKANEIASYLVQLNTERKALTEKATAELCEQIQKQQHIDDVLVLFAPTLHESIAGIVAGRIKDRFHHPTIVLTNSEQYAKGSARSIEGYHIFKQLFACKELFTRFGGHAMAAGLSLPKQNIPILREKLNTYSTLSPEDFIPTLRVEQLLSFTEIDITLASELQQLAPFGKENPSPLFATLDVFVEQLRLVGKNRNILQLRLKEEKSGMIVRGVSFDGLPQLKELLSDLYPNENCDTILHRGKLPMKLDFVYRIDIDTYQNLKNVQLVIKDFRVSK